MFYAQSENKYINEGTAFELGGIFYPLNWLNLSSPEEKAAIGLEEVVATNSPGDDRYYWVSETLNGASLTYVNTPKDLAGLKTSSAGQVNATAYSLLVPTDYIDIRNLRDPNYKVDWMLWRDQVRQTATATVTSIDVCTTVDELKAVVDQIAWPKDPSQTEEQA